MIPFKCSVVWLWIFSLSLFYGRKRLRSDCSHVRESPNSGQQVCPHLLGAVDVDYLQVFTGKSRAYRLACPACNSEPDVDSVRWRSVCAACFTEIETENGWDGIRGTPEIAVELSSLLFIHRTVPMPGDGSLVLRLVGPIPEADGSLWIGLTASGQLVRIDLNTGALQTIAEISVSDLDIYKEVSLLCSPNGEFVCLTETLGNREWFLRALPEIERCACGGKNIIMTIRRLPLSLSSGRSGHCSFMRLPGTVWKSQTPSQETL